MSPLVVVVDGHAVEVVHDCNAKCGDGVTRMLTARAVKLDDRWTVTGPDDAATLDPSIQCEACGLHGHWRNGEWTP